MIGSKRGHIEPAPIRRCNLAMPDVPMLRQIVAALRELVFEARDAGSPASADVLIMTAVALIVASPAAAAERPPAALYQRWLHADEDCRGGPGDSPDTMKACEYRGTIDRRLTAAGWCYGDGGRGGPYMDWRRCRR